MVSLVAIDSTGIEYMFFGMNEEYTVRCYVWRSLITLMTSGILLEGVQGGSFAALMDSNTVIQNKRCESFDQRKQMQPLKAVQK